MVRYFLNKLIYYKIYPVYILLEIYLIQFSKFIIVVNCWREE